jgi:hypothetical protein
MPNKALAVGRAKSRAPLKRSVIPKKYCVERISMNSFIGVSSLETNNLKQMSLFFDKIVLTEKGRELILCDYDMLCAKGMIYEPEMKGSFINKFEKYGFEYALKDTLECSIDPYAKKLIEDFKIEKETTYTFSASQRLYAIGEPHKLLDEKLLRQQHMKYSISDLRLYAAVLRISEGVDATPISCRNAIGTMYQTGHSPAISVILRQLPIPSENTPWQDLLDFRSNEEARGSLVALRKWIRKLAKEGLSQTEIEEEFEYLLHSYKEHMNYHNIKWKHGLLKTIISIPFELAENIVKIKWKDGIAALFSVQKNRLALMKAELDAPGREITYVLKAREKF